MTEVSFERLSTNIWNFGTYFSHTKQLIQNCNKTSSNFLHSRTNLLSLLYEPFNMLQHATCYMILIVNVFKFEGVWNWDFWNQRKHSAENDWLFFFFRERWPHLYLITALYTVIFRQVWVCLAVDDIRFSLFHGILIFTNSQRFVYTLLFIIKWQVLTPLWWID